MSTKSAILLLVLIGFYSCQKNKETGVDTIKFSDEHFFTFKAGELVISSKPNYAVDLINISNFDRIEIDPIFEKHKKELKDCSESNHQIQREISKKYREVNFIKNNESYKTIELVYIDTKTGKELKYPIPEGSTFTVQERKILSPEGKHKLNALYNQIKGFRVRMKNCNLFRDSMNLILVKHRDKLEAEINKYRDSSKIQENRELESVINLSKKERLLGGLGYAIPDTMNLNSPTRIELFISPSNSRDSLIITSDNTDLDWEEIPISQRMEAILNDPSPKNENYHIESHGSRIQNINQNEITKWIWHVTPLKEGKLPINLSIQIIEIDSTSEVLKLISVYDKEIYIVSRKETNKIYYLAVPIILGLSFLVFYFFRRKEQNSILNKNSIDDEELRNEIFRLIEKDRVEEALDKLIAINSLAKKKRLSFSMLKSQLTENNHKLNVGIISNEEANRKKNQIRYSILKEIEK